MVNIAEGYSSFWVASYASEESFLEENNNA
jgi:hypothetical protein